MKKQQSKKPKKFGRIYYTSDSAVTQRADFWDGDDLRESHLVISWKSGSDWEKETTILDHGNGLVLEGSNFSLNLTYSDAGDLRLALQAIQDSSEERNYVPTFNKYDKRVVTVRRRKSK
jgi:hypothetical protein